MNTNMIIVAILVLLVLVKLRFPASTPISTELTKFLFFLICHVGKDAENNRAVALPFNYQINYQITFMFES